MESRMLDFPVPFNPVIALNSLSNPSTSHRLPYDLKPSITIDLMYILIIQLNSNFVVLARRFLVFRWIRRVELIDKN